MASLQARLSGSIRWRLSAWLTGAIVGIAAMAAALSFFGAADEANELQDDTLRQVAALMRQQPNVARALDSDAGGADPESNLIVQRYGVNAASSGAGLLLPPQLAVGVHTVYVSGVPYRVLVGTLRDGSLIAVSQQTEVREEIARDSALRSLVPLLLLMPVLTFVVATLVRRMLLPVERLSRHVEARSRHELQALDEQGIPLEVRPLVHAVNQLLARLGQAMEAERQFVANAAHELRTPLTALSLQAQRLGEVSLPDPARLRLAVLEQGLARARRLLDQLLGYARAQATLPVPSSSVSLPQACRDVIEDLLPLAQARDIDLGMLPGADELSVAGAEEDLIVVVRNLVDNALRYTPQGGRVDVRLSRDNDWAVLEVEDSGPGIAAADRRRVFDPFFRLPGTQPIGSGLGLSIVRAVAARLGGELTLSDSAAFSSGLRVRVQLPLGAPALMQDNKHG